MAVKHKTGLSHAFTIVELLVVIVVVGILATITIVSYTGISSKANIASLVSDLDNSSRLLKMYQVEHGGFPTSFDANNCPLGTTAPSPDTKYCIKPSSSNTYTYKTSPTNNSIFCMTSTKGAQSYNISPDTQPLAGPCPVLRLDASNTASYPGSGTIWNDLSGFDNNGAMNGNITYNVINNGVLSFNGVDGYVALPSGLQSQVYNAISVSAWFKISTGVQQSGDWGSYIVHNGASWYVGDSIYALAINTTGPAVWSWVGNYASMTTSATYNDNSWHYIVGVWDGANSMLYMDGTLARISPIVTNITGMAGALTIGGSSLGATSRPFNGLISSVNIYNKAISSNDVMQNFNITKKRYGL